VSFLRSGNWTSDPRERSEPGFVQKRRAIRSDYLGEATLACARCDAPVAIGPQPLSTSDSLTCPFCGHQDRVGAFVSLQKPTRPTRVVLRVRFGKIGVGRHSG
jgi:DNA-directed RNA polymerase subunit RPC12/RpoP